MEFSYSCPSPSSFSFTGQGFTKELYEELRKEVDWENNPPTGIILHAAALDKSGNIQVADIWESEQDFTNFINSRLKAGFDKINAPMPKGDLYEIHNINAHPGIDTYKLSRVSNYSLEIFYNLLSIEL